MRTLQVLLPYLAVHTKKVIKCFQQIDSRHVLQKSNQNFVIAIKQALILGRPINVGKRFLIINCANTVLEGYIFLMTQKLFYH